MASDGVDKLKIQLIHGQQKHALCLALPPEETGEVLNVGHLGDAVSKVTGIPAHNQRLIFKGKSLTDVQSSLSSLGMKDTSKVMLIGKKHNEEEQSISNQLDKIGRLVDVSGKKLSEVIHEVDGIHRGYLSPDLHVSALTKLQRRLGSCAEDFTKQLEMLDALSLGNSGPQFRSARKALVNRIQELLSRCDSISSGVTDMMREAQK